MNKAFAGWKYALIIAVTLLGALLALPNWYGKSPTVQMQFASPEAATAAAQEITNQLRDANIAPERWKVQGENLNLFFPQTDVQIQARDLLTSKYPDNAVSVNLLPNTPTWLQSIGLAPMNLGLDLRGGISFLLQVDSNELFTRKSADSEKNNIPLLGAEAAANGGALISYGSDADRERALDELRKVLPQNLEQVNLE